MGSGIAQGQTPAATEGSAPDSDALPAMTVTGSHLLHVDAAAVPVTTIDGETIRASGVRSLGEYLKALPMMSGAPLGTTVGARESGGAFSRGIETVELRGLGAERTLVLLNGRRMIASGNGTAGLVDLSSIPLGIVQRIEVLKNGASVEYGADAVAGVVNVITRSTANPLEFRASAQKTDRGDGDSLRASLISAREFEATQLLMGVEWFQQQAVSKGARSFSRVQYGVAEGSNALVAQAVSSAPPQGRFKVPDTGNLILRDGQDGTSPDDFRPFEDPEDRYNFNPFEDLIQASQRLSLFAQADRSLGAVDWHTEVLLQQRDGKTGLAPLPFFTRRLDGVSVSEENLYNPFEVEITDARRRIVEAGGRAFEQDAQLWRVATEWEGSWGEAIWDVFLSHGRSRLEQRQSGDWLRDRTALALGPSYRVNGEARCGTPEQPEASAECVPLNLFGGAGSISPDMLAYLAGEVLIDQFRNDQTVIGMGWRQDIANLAAGPLTMAFGAEYRDESARDIPDSETQAGNTTGAARAVTRGGYQATDLYLEMGVPLVVDQPGIKDMEIEGGIRLVDYSNFDRHTVFDLGWYYEPTADWALRLAYSQSFRAPTVGELYGGGVQSNPAVEDPCSNFAFLSDEEINRCVAQGVPADGSFDQTGNETPQLGGGNPNLDAEDAKTLTAGLRWAPESWRGFSLNVDYYDIRIEKGIAALGAETILAECIETGAAAFCDRISRAEDGAIREVRAQLQNIGEDSARGLDIDLRYRYDSGWGAFRHRFLLSHVLERRLRAFPGGPAFVGEGEYDADNFGAIPEWKAHYSLAWQLQAWKAAVSSQWIGSLRERGGELASGLERRIPDIFYHDLSVSWQAETGAQISLGINNLTDQAPPLFANADQANTDVTTYRLLGRTAVLRFAYDW